MTIKQAFEKLTAVTAAAMKNPFFVMRKLHDAFADVADKIVDGGGSTVSVEAILTEGTKIATITVDGDDTDLYAPTASSGINYSTTEHVIGKWIDNSDIYERTFTSLSIGLLDDWVNTVDISQMNVSECIGASGWDNGTYQVTLNTKIDSGYIQVYMPGMAGITLTKISIKYTKSTT